MKENLIPIEKPSDLNPIPEKFYENEYMEEVQTVSNESILKPIITLISLSIILTLPPYILIGLGITLIVKWFVPILQFVPSELYSILISVGVWWLIEFKHEIKKLSD